MKEICKIIGFWAPENKKYCEEFSAGHEAVLIDHGFSHFKSNEDSWHESKDTFVFVAVVDDEVVGGIRLEKKVSGRLLSLEKAILPIDKRIIVLMDALKNRTVVESCGLWNSRKIAGRNISQILTRLCTVVSPMISNDIVSFCFNATYTFRITRSLGYSIVTSLGTDGYMNYPTPNYKAALWMNDDLVDLELADDFEKERILSLRGNLTQEYNEPNKRGQILIQYEINI
ncbi:MAG: hypothetical protein COA58_16450 [Bacteroidetes bacterium]|nr:MAG: hypothetical protein COA58_16450 [Bacteroidota bacterium]